VASPLAHPVTKQFEVREGAVLIVGAGARKGSLRTWDDGKSSCLATRSESLPIASIRASRRPRNRHELYAHVADRIAPVAVAGGPEGADPDRAVPPEVSRKGVMRRPGTL